MSKTNPFRDNLVELAHNRRHEQLINVDKLNSYKYQYEIHKNQDNTGVVKTKDISLVGVSTPQHRQAYPLYSGSKISVHTDIQVDFNNNNPFKDDVRNVQQQDKSATDKKRIEIATIESSIHQPHVVERRFYSEEELRFKENEDSVIKVAETENKTEIKILRDKSKDRNKVKTKEDSKGKGLKFCIFFLKYLG